MRTRLRHANRWRHAERGASTIVMFILLLPMLFVAFGIGFDSIRLVYARNYAQSRLDLALESAVSVTYTDVAGGTRIGNPNDPTSGPRLAADFYAVNTEGKRDSGSGGLLACSEAEILYQKAGDCRSLFRIIGTVPGQNYDYCADLVTGEKYGLRGIVTESVNPLFLRFAGVDVTTVTIESEVPLRGANC